MTLWMDRFAVALFLSCLIHLSGSVLVSIRNSNIRNENRAIDVGLVETEWSERWIDLPGNTLADQKVFEDHADLSSAIKDSRPVFDSISLPDAEVMADPSREDIWTSPARIFEVSSPQLGGNGESADKEEQMIQGPISERRVIYRPDPVYPEWAMQYGIEFELKVKLWVTPGGEVSDAYVENSSGYPEVDADVVRTVKKWRFNEIDSRLGMQWGLIKFNFRLDLSV